MKPIFKHTAMAVFVSFGLSGCFLTGSSDKPNHQPEATQINQPQQPADPAVANKLDKNGEEWRHIRVTSSNEQGKSRTTTYQTDSIRLPLDGENDETINRYLDLGEQGKFSQGLNSGKVEGVTVKSFWAAATDELNYLVINQPYSSYGALFTEQDGKFFYLGQNASTEGSTVSDNSEYQVGKYNSETKNVTWNDSVAGDATYQGEVIASVIPDEARYARPVVDGTIILNAHFENGYDKSHVSVSLDSKSIGKVNFSEKGRIQHDGRFTSSENQSTTHTYLTGNYSGQFVGQAFNDVVGEIRLYDSAPDARSEIERYQAVFGATKQK